MFAERNSGPLKRHLLLARNPHCLSVMHGWRYTIECSLPNTHTGYIELDGERKAGRERGQGEGVRNR